MNWEKKLLYGVGAVTGISSAALIFTYNRLSQERNYQEQEQANLYKGAATGAGAIAALGFLVDGLFNKGRLTKSLGRMIGGAIGGTAGSSHPILSGLSNNFFGAIHGASDAVHGIGRGVSPVAKFFLGGNDLAESMFPNIHGVSEHNVLGHGGIGNLSKFQSQRFLDAEVRKAEKVQMGKAWYQTMGRAVGFKGEVFNASKNQLTSNELRKHVIDDLNGNIWHRLRLNPRIGAAIGVGGLLVGGFRAGSGATYNPSPAPSVFYDGVSMRRTGDMGMNQAYADSVRGVDTTSLQGLALHLI